MTDECINFLIDSRNGGWVCRDLTFKDEYIARSLPTILQAQQSQVIISIFVIVQRCNATSTHPEQHVEL